jgi:hypothetical protein
MIEYRKLKKGLPIFITKLPDEIVEEIKEWIIDCKKYKDSPLAPLKHHDNVGTNHNNYQVAIPRKHIDNGFFLSFLLRFCHLTFGGNSHRLYKLREHPGHFDGYDIWSNFTYKNDDNPRHNHGGDISGVLYVKNDDTPTIFTEHDIGYAGTENTLIIFPSKTFHKVEPKDSIDERITIAFNIEVDK